MIWALVLLGVLALAIVSRGIRAVLFVAVGLLVVLGIALAGYLWYDQTQMAEEQARSRQRIGPAQIELADLTLQPALGGGAFYVVGRVRNRAPTSTLTRLALQVTLEDCPLGGGEAACEVVGQTVASIRVSVPAGQARDIREHVSFSGVGAPKGRQQWRYAVMWIEGR